MTLSKDTNQRERDKYEDVGGKTTVRVKVESGSITLPTGAATSDNQTNGSQLVKIKETVPTDPSKLNGSEVITGFSSKGDDLTITDTIKGVNYQFTTVWTGSSAPYTLTVSTTVIV